MFLHQYLPELKLLELGTNEIGPVGIEALAGVDPLHKKLSTSPTSVMSGSVQAAPGARGSAEVSAVAKENAMLVVLSDVWLDDPNVLRQLAELFKGYEGVGAQQIGSGRAATPLASFFTFVLCGNFTSGGLSGSGTAAPPTGSDLRQGFHDLAVLLQRTPILAEHAHFVLVPGPADPSIGTPDVLPRAPLSSCC